MTTDDEMRRLAEAATGGPWIEDPDEPGVVMRPDRPGGWDGTLVAVASLSIDNEANAAFIAAANPAAVLALLDRVAAAEAEVERADEIIRKQAAIIRRGERYIDGLESVDLPALRADVERESKRAYAAEAAREAGLCGWHYKNDGHAEIEERAEKAEAESAALRATVERVRTLADEADAFDRYEGMSTSALRAALDEEGGQG